MSQLKDTLVRKNESVVGIKAAELPADLRHGSLSREQLKRVQKTLNKFLNDQIRIDEHFWAFDWTTKDLCALAVGMLLQIGAHEHLQMTWIELLDFITDVERGYFGQNPYHSFRHAMDVTVVVYLMLTKYNQARFFIIEDLTTLLISALCHDICHPGLNNLYQVNGKTDLAMLYKDISVLENYSCSRTLVLLRKHGMLRSLSEEGGRYFCDCITSNILSTDMSVHFDLLKDFNKLVSDWFPDESDEVKIQVPLSSDHRRILCRTLLHAADISNPCRPWQVCKRWSDLVVEEFFNQGDAEKRDGLPVSPNMDRENSNQVDISLGFSDFIVRPYFEAMAGFSPELDEFVKSLDNNRTKWLEIRNVQADKQTLEVEGHSKDLTRSASFKKPSPIATNTHVGVSNSSIEETAQLLRSALSGRRLSVAAGVITLPDNFSSPPVLSKASSTRKISYEYSETSSTSTGSLRVSASTIGSTFKRSPQKASLTNLEENSLNASSHSVQSSSPAAGRSQSRRASAISATEDEGLYKTMMKRRNSQAAAIGTISHSSTMQGITVTSPRGGIMRTSSFPQPQTSPKSLTIEENLARFALTDSPESYSDEDRALEPDSYSPLIVSQDEVSTANRRRMSKPQNYLHYVSSQLTAQTIKNMLVRSQMESALLSRGSHNRETLNSTLGSSGITESNYSTIHRSDKILEHLQQRMQKSWALEDSQNELQDDSVHFAHAGVIQVKADKVLRSSSDEMSNPRLRVDKLRQTRTGGKSLSETSLFEIFASRSNQRGFTLSRRYRAKSDVYSHKRGISDGVILFENKQ